MTIIVNIKEKWNVRRQNCNGNLTEINRFIISQLQQSKINTIECHNNCGDSIQNDVNLNQAHHGGQISKLYCQDIAKACIKTHNFTENANHFKNCHQLCSSFKNKLY
ncbi:hypothetical protein A3Q56_08655 [Intoshia linei]|uniref:Uncharacterized protein n=1 Tax=Intoshia linei TaxID=1819745 RepID=A0A177ANN9_9BILA|nr:hypothetical protein A3Q56_08655 [Intoshia linei]